MLKLREFVKFLLFLAVYCLTQRSVTGYSITAQVFPRRSAPEQHILQPSPAPFSNGGKVHDWAPIPEGDTMEEDVAKVLRYYFELFKKASVKGEIKEERYIFLGGDLEGIPNYLIQDTHLYTHGNCPSIEEFRVHFSLTEPRGPDRNLYIYIFNDQEMKNAFDYSCDKINAKWKESDPFDAVKITKQLNRLWKNLWISINSESGDVIVNFKDGDKVYTEVIFNVPSVLSTYQRSWYGGNKKLKSFPKLTRFDIRGSCPPCKELQAVSELVKMSRQIAAGRLAAGRLVRERSSRLARVMNIIKGKWQSQQKGVPLDDTNILRYRKLEEFNDWLRLATFRHLKQDNGEGPPPQQSFPTAVSFAEGDVMAVANVRNANIIHYEFILYGMSPKIQLPPSIAKSRFVCDTNFVLECSEGDVCQATAVDNLDRSQKKF